MTGLMWCCAQRHDVIVIEVLNVAGMMRAQARRRQRRPG